MLLGIEKVGRIANEDVLYTTLFHHFWYEKRKKNNHTINNKKQLN